MPITIIASLLGIILSQIEPLYTYFEKPSFTFSLDMNKIVFKHDFGNLIIENWIQLKNDGDIPGTVKSINIYMEKVNYQYFQKIFTATAYKNYYTYDEYGNHINEPVFDIYLPSQNYMLGLMTFKEQVKPEYALMVSRLKNDIYYQTAFYDDTLHYIDSITKAKVDSLTYGNLQNLSVGEYRFIIIMRDDHNRIIIPDNFYTLNIADDGIDFLYEDVEYYSTGGNGISYEQLPIERGFSAIIGQFYDKKEINMMVERYELFNSKCIGYVACD